MKFPSPISGPNQLIVLGAIGFVLLLLIAGLIFKQEAVTNYAKSGGNWLDNPRSLTALGFGSKGSSSDGDLMCEVGEEDDSDCQCNDGSVIDPVATPGAVCGVIINDGDDGYPCRPGEIRYTDGCRRAVELCGANYINYCNMATPPIWHRTYSFLRNSVSGQSFTDWLERDDDWWLGDLNNGFRRDVYGNIAFDEPPAPIFSFFQIKWDAEALLANRERYHAPSRATDAYFNYQSSFTNCRFDQFEKNLDGTDAYRITLGNGRSGTYTGFMGLNRWWGDFEIICDNSVVRYYGQFPSLTDPSPEIQLALAPVPTGPNVIGGRIYYDAGTISSESTTECEIPFDSIVDGLDSEGITRITENTFRGWASNDSFDDCDYSTNGDYTANGTCTRLNPTAYSNRSGAVDDIKTVMEGMEESIRETLGNEDYGYGIRVLLEMSYNQFSTMKRTIDSEYPAPLFLSVIDGDGEIEKIDVVIALSVTEENVPNSLVGRARSYRVRVLDPIGPRLRNLYCFSTDFLRNGSETVMCINPNIDSDGELDPAIWDLLLDWAILGFGLTELAELLEDGAYSMVIPSKISGEFRYLQDTFARVCDGADNEVNRGPFCLSRLDLLAWLIANYPNINGIDMPYGWVDFVLKTTYLGDFVGECPHPTSININ